jgi:hypothetical protein
MALVNKYLDTDARDRKAWHVHQCDASTLQLFIGTNAASE